MVKAMNYYFLAEKVKPNTAFAYTLGETPLSHELISNLKGIYKLPFELELKKVSSSKIGLEVSNDLSNVKYLWVDYQPNNLAWPLMSEKLKTVIEKKLTGKENISWITTNIKADGEERKYFIPFFNKRLDVLDMQRTMFVSGTDHIIKPFFSLEKIINYSLFHKPNNFWEITSALYVSEVLKKDIEKEKLTGLSFETISII